MAGALPEVLERLAIYYEREDELRKRYRSTDVPVITVAAVIMIIVMLFSSCLWLSVTSAIDRATGYDPGGLGRPDWLVRWWYAVGFGLLLVAVGTRRYPYSYGADAKDASTAALASGGNLRKWSFYPDSVAL